MTSDPDPTMKLRRIWGQKGVLIEGNIGTSSEPACLGEDSARRMLRHSVSNQQAKQYLSPHCLVESHETWFWWR